MKTNWFKELRGEINRSSDEGQITTGAQERLYKILSRFEASQAHVDGGLREELLKLSLDEDNIRHGVDVSAISDAISRHPAHKTEEPLAVLADRKGSWIEGWYKVGNIWRIRVESNDKDGSIVFRDENPDEAEKAARAFLEALPDREGR